MRRSSCITLKRISGKYHQFEYEIQLYMSKVNFCTQVPKRPTWAFGHPKGHLSQRVLRTMLVCSQGPILIQRFGLLVLVALSRIGS